MSITKENKKILISKFAINDNDTGSAEIQIAVLSERIKNLTKHFNDHKHDNHSKTGLIAMVNTRKKLLKELTEAGYSEDNLRELQAMLDALLSMEFCRTASAATAAAAAPCRPPMHCAQHSRVG